MGDLEAHERRLDVDLEAEGPRSKCKFAELMTPAQRQPACDKATWTCILAPQPRLQKPHLWG